MQIYAMADGQGNVATPDEHKKSGDQSTGGDQM